MDVAGDWVMGERSVVATHRGAIAIDAEGDMVLTAILSDEGSVSLVSAGAIHVATDGMQPQVVTAGDLSVASGHGIGGYLFDRLYVDVRQLTVHQGSQGDVVISGYKGLDVAFAHSDSAGWMTLLSGPAGQVTGHVPTAAGNRVARVSGRTLIASDLLAGRQMFNANIFYTPDPVLERSPAADTLDAFNAQLSKQWLSQQQAQSSLDRLSVSASDLGSVARKSPQAAVHHAGFSATVLHDTGAMGNTIALLEAALQLPVLTDVEDVFGGDMLSSWAQRSVVARSPSTSQASDDAANAARAEKPVPTEKTAAHTSVKKDKSEAPARVKQDPTVSSEPVQKGKASAGHGAAARPKSGNKPRPSQDVKAAPPQAHAAEADVQASADAPAAAPDAEESAS